MRRYSVVVLSVYDKPVKADMCGTFVSCFLMYHAHVRTWDMIGATRAISLLSFISPVDHMWIYCVRPVVDKLVS